MTSGTTSGLILIADNGETDPLYNEQRHQGGNYTKAKCDGVKSTYIIYENENFDGTGASQLVETEEVVDFPQPIRSFQGYNKNGIMIFPDSGYGGQGTLYSQSVKNITGTYPNGIASIIVRKGEWVLYSGQNFMGTKIEAGDMSTFGPKCEISFSAEFKHVKSIKLIE